MALAEDESVEEVVEDVARRSGYNQRHADNDAVGSLAAHQTRKHHGKVGYGYNAEHGQEHRAHKLHAEGHAAVFCEDELKPVGDVVAFVEREVRLDFKLDELVYKDNGDAEQHGKPAALLDGRHGAGMS